jgi:predicted Zn-dependent peptidase
VRLRSLLAGISILVFLGSLPPALASNAPATGAATPDTGTPAGVEPGVQETVLKNGLKVLTKEVHAGPVVAVWTWYRVGSRNERPGITGISHFFEHMMFNGAAKYGPKMYDRTLESNGGLSNAFTDRDVTAYYEDIASDRYEVLFDLDSDRMASLALLPDMIKSEREVVKEERRFRTDNFIPGMLDESLYAAAYLASSYHWPVVGWMGDLDAITREQMVDYFRIHYAPNNCVLVLTGDFDTKPALALIEKYFGGIAAQTKPVEPVNAEPEQHGERHVEVRYPAENVSFQLGYKAPAVADSAAFYPLQVLEAVLGQGESSRLHQALVYDQQLATSASASYRPCVQPTLFEVYVEMRPEKSAAQGLAAVDTVLARVAREGIQAAELQKGKNMIEANLVRQLATNNGVGQELGFYETVFGDYRALYRVIDQVRAVTADQVRDAARKVLDREQRTVAELAPAPEEGP